MRRVRWDRTEEMIRYNLYKWSAILGAIGMVIVIAYYTLRTLPEGKRTLGVRTTPEYAAATTVAMGVWNDWVGCEFLVKKDRMNDISVMADDGDPCGDPWRPEDEWGHDATAYQCKDVMITTTHGDLKWTRAVSEILISHPGNLHTQAHIIAHEIGHVLQRPHQTIGVMGRPPDPNGSNKMLRISDADKKALSEEFCP